MRRLLRLVCLKLLVRFTQFFQQKILSLAVLVHLLAR